MPLHCPPTTRQLTGRQSGKREPKTRAGLSQRQREAEGRLGEAEVPTRTVFAEEVKLAPDLVLGGVQDLQNK